MGIRTKEWVDVDQSTKLKQEDIHFMVDKLYGNQLQPSRTVIKLSKSAKLFILIVIALCGFLFSLVFNYNKFIVFQERIESNMGNIEAELQRRANLFNNLVSLTLDYASLEREVFDFVAESRNRSRLKTVPGLNTAGLDQPISVGPNQSPAGLENILSQIQATVEEYPDIKSSSNYQYLMENITEIENRLVAKRAQYNEHVREFNNRISTVPWKFMAWLFGFEKVEYFKTEEANKADPVILPKQYKKILHASNPDY